LHQSSIRPIHAHSQRRVFHVWYAYEAHLAYVGLAALEHALHDAVIAVVDCLPATCAYERERRHGCAVAVKRFWFCLSFLLIDVAK
jgi:hypothetical protein